MYGSDIVKHPVVVELMLMYDESILGKSGWTGSSKRQFEPTPTHQSVVVVYERTFNVKSLFITAAL